MPLKIAIACDHRGFAAKQKVSAMLHAYQAEMLDLGCDSSAAVDYADYAVALGREVAGGRADLGILLDKSGVGMSISANKIKGIRAALAHDEVTARLCRAHNHCNVLCVGVDLVTDDQLKKIIDTFLTTSFEGGRHERRVAKVNEIMG